VLAGLHVYVRPGIGVSFVCKGITPWRKRIRTLVAKRPRISERRKWWERRKGPHRSLGFAFGYRLPTKRRSQAEVINLFRRREHGPL